MWFVDNNGWIGRQTHGCRCYFKGISLAQHNQTFLMIIGLHKVIYIKCLWIFSLGSRNWVKRWIRVMLTEGKHLQLYWAFSWFICQPILIGNRKATRMRKCVHSHWQRRHGARRRGINLYNNHGCMKVTQFSIGDDSFQEIQLNPGTRRRATRRVPIMKCRYESRFSHALNNPEGSINLTKSTCTTLE